MGEDLPFQHDRYQRDVFISYHQSNRAWVDETLVPRLEAAGLKVAVDYQDFLVGMPRIRNVEQAVETSRHTLVVMTPAWVDSGWADFEGLLVRSSDPAARRRRLIPLLLEPTHIPRAISMLTYVDLTGSAAQDEGEMKRLLAGLVTKSRVFLSYANGTEPDCSLGTRLAESLEQEGHRVATTATVTVGASYRDDVQARIADSDFVVVLLSSTSVRQQEILEQVRYTHQCSARTGRPRLLPVRVVYQDPLPAAFNRILSRLGYTSWNDRDDDESVTRRLLDAMSHFRALTPQTSPAEEVTAADLSSRGGFWPNGSVVEIGFLDGDAALQWRVAQAATEWTRYANLRFVFGPASDSPIRITFKQPGSWSYLGTSALTIPKDQPTVCFGWLKNDSPDEEVRGTVLHELGHLLGLVHEHQIPNARIEWNRDAVVADLTGAPHFMTRQQVEHTMFQRYDRGYFPIAKSFDPTSIMMYPMPETWTNGTISNRRNMELSAYDKEFIGKLYPAP